MNVDALHASDRFATPYKLHYRDLRRFLDQLQWSLDHITSVMFLYTELIRLAPATKRRSSWKGCFCRKKSISN
ncbi:hypothetical protein LJK87_25845 [Paenibacillus sp. P25]|nr:hypothetical protein LJK87_25845 [Paenibacillus sp. P25]